jgi:hypothetical protein
MIHSSRRDSKTKAIAEVLAAEGKIRSFLGEPERSKVLYFASESTSGVHFLVSYVGLRRVLLWESGGFPSCGLGVLVHEILFLRAFPVESLRT